MCSSGASRAGTRTWCLSASTRGRQHQVGSLRRARGHVCVFAVTALRCTCQPPYLIFNSPPTVALSLPLCLICFVAVLMIPHTHTHQQARTATSTLSMRAMWTTTCKASSSLFRCRTWDTHQQSTRCGEEIALLALLSFVSCPGARLLDYPLACQLGCPLP